MNVGTVYAKDNGAVVADLRAITSGMVGATVRIVFDSTWEGYNKTLVWKAGDVTKDDTTASGVIPPEVLEVPGVQLEVGVYGVKDGVVTPTVYAKLGQILPGADPSGDTSTDPSLPVWVQVQADIERLEAAKDDAVQAANDAEGHKDEAHYQATQAAGAADAAKESQNSATLSAGQAVEAARTASAGASAASTSATAAEEAKAAAEAAADRAEAAEGVAGKVRPEDTTFFSVAKNLYNPDTVTEGAYVNQASGAQGNSSSNVVTDYIPVVGGETYVASYEASSGNRAPNGGSDFRYACYDVNKVYIQGGNGASYNPIVLPDDAAYVRYSFHNSKWKKNQFEKGTEPTAYEPYGAPTQIQPEYIPQDAELDARVKVLEDICNVAGAFPLNLPPKLYALEGEELNVYFDNLVAGRDTDYTFDVTCSVGMQMERCYRLTPTEAGSYDITIKATDRAGTVVEKAATLYVAAASARAGVTESVLVLGDSTTDNGIAVSKLHENFSADVMGVTTLGTRGDSPNNHEGRSGWSFAYYFTKASTTKMGTNPFYNPETATFDVDYYFATTGVAIPDWFFVNLGINDVFGFTDDGALHQAMQTILARYDTTVAGVKAAAPGTKVGVVLTIPPNHSQDAFGKDYGCEQTRDRYKRNNALWVQELISRYGGREAEGIYLVPIHTNLDTVYNMGAEAIPVNKRNSETYASAVKNGGVHPRTSGYWQIADVYWFFLKNQV